MPDLKPGMGPVFVSYVTEDLATVRYIVRVLRHNGVPVWWDKDSIPAGSRWMDEITRGIEQGAAYIPIFSDAWKARERTVANEELAIAIAELRRRPEDRVWFIPVALSPGSVPERNLGGSARLSDIQTLSLNQADWHGFLAALLAALGIDEPDIDPFNPLSTGLPSQVAIVGGQLIYETTKPPVDAILGTVFTFTGGACWRAEDGSIRARLETIAPSIHLQQTNEQLGLHLINAVCLDAVISTDEDRPSVFSFDGQHRLPRGTRLIQPGSPTPINLPFDMEVRTVFTAYGSIRASSLVGSFKAQLIYGPGTGFATYELSGSFNAHFAPLYGPRGPGDT